MSKLRFALCLLLLSAFAQAAPRQEWFRNLSLENAVATSDLILAVQVTEVTEIKLMRGGKGESAMYQYKFRPVSVLRGVFARDELSLGSADLGLYRLEEMKEIKQGDFRLIFLGRSDVGYRNNNRVDNGGLGQSMPPLRDAQDPLLEAVRTLLKVNSEADRGKRVALLIDGMKKTSGAGAVALLKSLDRRSLLAAQNADTAGAIAPFLTDASPAVRESAAQTLRGILEADYLEHGPLRETAVAKSIEALKSPDANTRARAAVIRVLGSSGAVATNNAAAIEQLIPRWDFGDGVTTIERAAKFRAIGDLKTDVPVFSVEMALFQVPLDDEGEFSRAAEYAIARVQPAQAVAVLRARLDRRIAAGLDARIEIESLADLPAGSAIPVLVEISKLVLERSEKEAFAQTCRKVVENKPDARLVDVLAGLLSPDEPSRYSAIEALIAIDTDAAAKVLQTHLREEQDLREKLHMAGMLGRHGIRDGYVYAIEHVSEQWYLEEAVAALAAIKEPQAVARLREILETSNDLAWNTAAVRGLGAMGAQEMTPKLLSLIDNLRNPLVPAALVALADLGEGKALEKAREGLGSRNDRIVTASARAAGKLLARPGVNDADLRARLAALLGDADANVISRTAALDALLALKDERLDGVLAKVVREANLEGSDLQSRVERLMRERKVGL